MAGFELDGGHFIVCYTPHSRHTVSLFDMMQFYMLAHPGVVIAYMGDFNVHNQEWLCSTVPTDSGGSIAQELCEPFGFNQYVDFATRGGNTLDPVLSTHSGSAVDVANLGSSDHVAVKFDLHVSTPLLRSPSASPVLDWAHAPWHHIKGALKSQLTSFDLADYNADDSVVWVDAALAAFNGILESVCDKYLGTITPGSPSPLPWLITTVTVL